MSLIPDSQVGVHLAGQTALSALELHTGGAGLLLGINRQHAPVALRLFRPEHTRVVVVGGLRCAHLLAIRSLALGAQVVIQSARPRAWEGLTKLQSRAVGFAPPGTVVATPSTSTRPLLVVGDVGPSVGDQDRPSPWRATVTLREEITAWDVDTLVRADLVIMQPLTEMEAALAGSALGLTEVQAWLSRIRADMVTLVSHGTVRWALLSPSPVERQLVGSVTR